MRIIQPRAGRAKWGFAIVLPPFFEWGTSQQPEREINFTLLHELCKPPLRGWCTFSPARLNVHALNTFFHLSRNGHSCNFNFSALTVNTCLWMKFIRAPDHRACLWPRVNASLVNGFRLIFGIVFVQYACLIHSLVTLSSIIQCKICFVTQKRKMLHWFSPSPSESPVRARLLLFALGSFHKSSEAERLSNRWYLKLESQKCFKAMWWKIWWIGFSQIIYE